MTRSDLSDALASSNVRAFLAVIRAGEGTSDEFGYRRMFGGDLFDSFDDHPRQIHTRPTRNGPLTSSAAGAYQFLTRTWDALAKQYGLDSFDPMNQDLGAVALIAGRGALQDVKGGNFDAAVRKCSHEWASLPGAGYGQPERTLAQAIEVYVTHGGEIATA
jgi:muramidase (phage lysozyme)